MFKTEVEIPHQLILSRRNDLEVLNSFMELMDTGYKYYGGSFVTEGYIVNLAKVTPYGVTWTNVKTTVCQTGYVFATLQEAERVAREGPKAAENAGIVVDGLADADYLHLVQFAHIETEGDTVGEEIILTGTHSY